MTYFKRYYYLGLFAYPVLLFLAVFFYQERTIFTDISYQLFFILKDQGLCIQNYRFGAVCTQVFPLLAQKMGLSLQGVMIAYSAGFVLYYFACYLLCGFVFENYRMGLVLLLFNTLFVSETFYWIQSELPQGIAFMIVLFAFLTSDSPYKKNIIAVILVCGALVTLAFFHPLLVFAFVYACLFFTFSRDTRIRGLIFYVIIYALAIVIKNVCYATAYDTMVLKKLNSLTDNLANFWGLYANERFVQSCLNRYYWIPVLFVAVSIAYGLRKKWIKLAFFLLASLGYYVLVSISFPDASTTANYMENLYLPLGIILILPLVYDILPNLRLRKTGLGVLAGIVLSGMLRIFLFHTGFTWRLAWEDQVLQKYAGRKVVIDSKDVPREKLIATWGSPQEFWLLSTIKYHKSASVVIADDPGSLKESMLYNDRFLMLWGTAPYSELKSKYYVFTDSVSKYELVKP